MSFLAIFALALPLGAAVQLDDEDPITLELKAADLVNVLSSFAGIQGLELEAEPGLEGSVSMQLEQVPWKTALDALCRVHSLECRIEGSVLRVAPAADSPPGLLTEAGTEGEPGAGKVGAPRHAFGAEPPTVTLELECGDDLVQGRLTFTWNRPVLGLSCAGGRWQARIAWIPLSAEQQVLVPLLVQCSGESHQDGDGDRSPEAIPLPLRRSRTLRQSDTELTLRPGSPKRPTIEDDLADCRLAEGRSLQISCASCAEGSARRLFELRAEPGLYTLLSSGSGLRTALVILGVRKDGSVRAGLLSPGSMRLHSTFTVSPDEPVEVSFEAADGRTETLRLRQSIDGESDS